MKNELNPQKKENMFELYGYDFLIDNDFRTWLIEVNTNPYLGIPNDFIKGLLPDMLDNMLSIVLDEKFPPSIPSNVTNDFKHIHSCNLDSTSDKE